MSYDYRCIVVGIDINDTMPGVEFQAQSLSGPLNEQVESWEKRGWEVNTIQVSWCGNKQIVYVWVRRERKPLKEEQIPDGVDKDVTEHKP